MLHMCNTSGILNYPEAHFDMVRTELDCMALEIQIKRTNTLNR